MKVLGLGLGLLFLGLLIGAFEPLPGVLIMMVSLGFIVTGAVRLNLTSGQRRMHAGGRRNRGWAAGGAASAGTYGTGDSGGGGSSFGGGSSCGGGGGGCGGGGGGC
ncbi:hypothetical protein [Nocardia sp. A7]|uniref:hypothetical protein n=1 Tax=Nocardia sp. A7 TaxID=2789274 RepID=UPI00397BBE05